MILSGTWIASFGTSFSWKVSHFVTWNVYASACCRESDFGIGTLLARGMSSGCGIAILTVWNSKAKVCVTRNASKTKNRKKKLLGGCSINKAGGSMFVSKSTEIFFKNLHAKVSEPVGR